MSGEKIKSAIQTRRFCIDQIVKVYAVNACLLAGCERRTFAASQYAFADRKSGSRPFLV